MIDKSEKRLFTIEESISQNGGPIPMSRAGLYKLCAEGKIPTISIGRRVFIPSWWVNKILDETKM